MPDEEPQARRLKWSQVIGKMLESKGLNREFLTVAGNQKAARLMIRPLWPSERPLSADGMHMATAADILGFHRIPKVPARWARHYQHLCAIRDRLTQRDGATPATPRAKLDDLGEAASDDAETSLSFVAASATQELLGEVLDAIRRIERGAFGICERTGQPIEKERLKAIPWTRYSLQGQTELESEGFGRRSGVPSLQAVGESDSADAEDAEGQAA
jgi:RNA polymerase-binding transcription factor DksA